MSGFYLLGLIGIWLVIGWIVYRLWRLVAVKKPVWIAVHLTVGIALLAVWVGVPFWTAMGKKIYFDNRVNELCTKDGGVHVFETVILPEEKFDEYGNVNVRSKEKMKVSDEYYYDIKEYILVEGDPSVLKYITTIYRRDDERALGDFIRYGRSGGDLPGFWHPSTYSCPKYSDQDISLEKAIFKKGSAE